MQNKISSRLGQKGRLPSAALATFGLLALQGCSDDDAADSQPSGVDGGMTAAKPDAGATMWVPPVTEPAMVPTSAPTVGCDPGLYTGRYTCKEGFSGPVSFDLVTKSSQQDSACGAEFCTDLVISEASGMLYGNWIILAFQGRLEGGLDCETGEFRATLVDGRAGLPDPSDPKGIIGFNSFEGSLKGKHQDGPPQVIAGAWSLTNADSSCVGTFSLERQP